jgi:YD repeat-containing protein
MTVSGKERYTVSYAYDANNRLLTERKTRGLLTDLTTYAYDANGNLLSKTFNGGDGSLTGATYTITCSISFRPQRKTI